MFRHFDARVRLVYSTTWNAGSQRQDSMRYLKKERDDRQE